MILGQKFFRRNTKPNFCFSFLLWRHWAVHKKGSMLTRSPTHHIQHYMIINLKYWSLVLSLANLYKIIYFFRTEPVCWGFGNMYCFGISLVWISLKSDLCDVGCVCVCVVGRMCHISFFLCLFIHISECAVSCNQLAFNSLQQMMKIKLLQYLKYVLKPVFFPSPNQTQNRPISLFSFSSKKDPKLTFVQEKRK